VDGTLVRSAWLGSVSKGPVPRRRGEVAAWARRESPSSRVAGSKRAWSVPHRTRSTRPTGLPSISPAIPRAIKFQQGGEGRSRQPAGQAGPSTERQSRFRQSSNGSGEDHKVWGLVIEDGSGREPSRPCSETSRHLVPDAGGIQGRREPSRVVMGAAPPTTSARTVGARWRILERARRGEMDGHERFNLRT